MRLNTHIISYTDEEIKNIKKYGCLCFATAKEAMERNNINFDQVESINDHYETHRWGSNADRIYRNKAVRAAIYKVADNPLNYMRTVDSY
jgi:hypothetical protein